MNYLLWIIHVCDIAHVNDSWVLSLPQTTRNETYVWVMAYILSHVAYTPVISRDSSSLFTADHQKWDTCVSHGTYIESCRIYTSCVPWLIHTCDMAQLYEENCAHTFCATTTRNHMCAMTYSHVRHVALTCATSHVQHVAFTCDDAHSLVRHDVFTRATCRTHICNIYNKRPALLHMWMRHVARVNTSWHTCECASLHVNVTRRTCDVTQPWMRHVARVRWRHESHASALIY